MPLPLGLHSMTICAIFHCRIWAYNESEKINFFSPYLTPAHPIWWGKEPMIIRTFLESYNLKGKRIVPFCASGGSGISDSMKGIRASAKGAKVVKGKDLTDSSAKRVKNWAKKKVK